MNPNNIYLAQTDTTVGFLSQDYKKLNRIKNRKSNQKILKEVDSLATLKEFVRVPSRFKKVVRRANKTTFIYPKGESFRVVKDKKHLEFLKKFRWLYSTSANISGKNFDEKFAKSVVDVVVGVKFKEKEASKLIKLGKQRCKRLR